MRNVIVRRWSLIAAIAIIILSFFINKQLSSMKEAPAQNVDFDKTPVVQVETVENRDIQMDIPLTGKLVSKNRIEIFSEVTGKLLATSKLFKEGTGFNRGEVLLKIDDTDARMSVQANRSNFHSQITQILADLKIDYPANFSNWKSYSDNFDATKPLPELPEVEDQQEKSLLVSRNIYNQFYNIKSQEAQLRKYIVTAPFSGIVASANVNPGSLIRAGQKVGEFLDPYLFDLEVGISIDDINKVRLGDKVVLTSNSIEGSWDGKVTRISKSVDNTTQTLKVYIQVYGKNLFEGVYLNASIGGRTVNKVSRISSNLIFDKNKIYLVEEDKLKLKEIEIIHEEGAQVIIQGIEDKSQLLNQVLAGSYDGMPVKIVSAK